MTRKRVTLFDYGAGNLHSLAKALRNESAACDLRTETDPCAAVHTDLLVLPGVGAFGPAARALAPARDVVRAALAAGLPCLGICLGMQLLFDESDEGGESDGGKIPASRGLGVIPGRVERLRASRVPQVGWNDIDDARDPLFVDAGLTTAYYANSFVCRPAPGASTDSIVAWSTHESDRFPAAVRANAGNTLGVQFHPEKSSAAGLRFIRAFLAENKC